MVSKIGKRLAVVRENAGFLQIPFAEKLGVSQSSYKNYERGASPVPASLIAKVCEDYDISPAWLLLGEGQIKSEMNGKLVEGVVLTIEKFAEVNNLEPPLDKKAKIIRFVYEEIVSGRDFKDKDVKRLFNTVM
ncbi:helix-turn-helix domain-containing protein [Roseibium algae]|uniref:Helix-turn-helix transcriptional regulator n=1 Tax=Roseibium algae TaxID=3123038 RepID=A0ABU8TKD7_9HYPH